MPFDLIWISLYPGMKSIPKRGYGGARNAMSTETFDTCHECINTSNFTSIHWCIVRTCLYCESKSKSYFSDSRVVQYPKKLVTRITPRPRMRLRRPVGVSIRKNSRAHAPGLISSIRKVEPGQNRKLVTFLKNPNFGTR